MRLSELRVRVGRLARWARRRTSITGEEASEEIRFHLEARTEQLVSRGFSRDAARYEARRLFGRVVPGPAAAGHRHFPPRAMHSHSGAESFAQDVRYALRGLRRTPVFSLTVIATLALGIGANAVMFDIIDRLILRGPEYVVAPERLFRLYRSEREPGGGATTYASMGYVSYAMLRDGARSFAGIAAYSPTDVIVGRGTDAAPGHMANVTWGFFDVLGVHPFIGRFFGADEDRESGGAHVVVLDYGLWMRRFGGERSAIGRAMVIGDVPYTIVGVAPPGFTGVELDRMDGWMPMSLRGAATTTNWSTTWSAQWLSIIGRLGPRVTPQRAAREATAIHRRTYRGHNASLAAASMTVLPTSYDRSGKESPETPVARWLFGVACIVFLIACANVTNLLLARGVQRRRELAVRLALGIGQWRLLRLLLVESVLLALAGGAVGLALAWVGGTLMRATFLPNVAWNASPVNGRVIGLALLLAAVTGAFVGLVPALRLRRHDFVQALKAGQREGGEPRVTLRTALVVAQAALSVVLLVGAGLFVQSLFRVRALDLGVEPDRVLTTSVDWPRRGGRSEEDAALERVRRKGLLVSALGRLSGTPGVEAAALAVGTPFGNGFSVRLEVPGLDSLPLLAGGGPYVSAVTSGYFSAAGIRLRRGRLFGTSEGDGTELVAIVNETMARLAWPGRDPLGACLIIGDAGTACSRVVGVVADAHRWRLSEAPAMQYYIPFGQERGIGGTSLLVRPVGDAGAFIEPLRRQLQALVPGALYYDIKVMARALDPQVRPWRLGAIMFAIFGALALLVSAVGLYSVITYVVAQRTHEFGVRLALGAQVGDIVRLVLSRGVGSAITGLAIGIAVALAASRYVQPLLFQTSARDPYVIGVVVATLIVVAVLASLLPARRATRVDPVIALRSE